MDKKQPFDVLIIGAGCAGLFLSLCLPATFRIGIIRRNPKSNSHYAQGGISAVSNTHDSFSEHIQDTLHAGHQLNQKTTVQKIIKKAPDVIKQLSKLGMKFTKNDDQKLHLHREAGHGHSRIAHYLDYTGKELMRCLEENTEKRTNITHLHNHCAIYLENQNDLYTIHTSSNKKYFTLSAQSIVLSTGGFSGIYSHHTGTPNPIGEGAYLALLCNAMLSNMEFTQFHPTCVHQQAPQNIITEAIRGAGATITDQHGQRFLFKYDKRGELAPRDITASAIYNTLKTQNQTHAWLDATFMTDKQLQKQFPQTHQICSHLGIDPSKEKIPIVPAAHYSCGGITTNAYGQTNIEKLYAIGEVACSGMHGANRLASNSLLECLAMACFASQNIANTISPSFTHNHIETSLAECRQHKTSISSPSTLLKQKQAICSQMWQKAGIVRCPEELRTLITFLREIKPLVSFDFAHCNTEQTVFNNYWMVATSIALSAIQRTESLGCHQMQYSAGNQSNAQKNSRISLKNLMQV